MIRRILPALLLVTVVFTSGCIVRTLRIPRHGAPSGQLATATLEELVGKVGAWDAQLHTINATVNLEPSVGSVNKGEIDQYKDIRAFVLIRKPGMFRLIGNMPVVGGRAFDMVTDGKEFKVHFPSKNKMVVGKNNMERPSDKKLENIRPQHLYDALVVSPIAADERAVLENHTDEADASYIIHVLVGRGNNLVLHRNLWFDRVGLRLSRQIIFDAKGDIVTDARYEDYKISRGIFFPHTITITRPMDEYGVKLTVQKLELNRELDDDKFFLTIPPGTEVFDLEHPVQKNDTQKRPEKSGVK
jgi:outer membrane lipoprotein-sorting protein